MAASPAADRRVVSDGGRFQGAMLGERGSRCVCSVLRLGRSPSPSSGHRVGLATRQGRPVEAAQFTCWTKYHGCVIPMSVMFNRFFGMPQQLIRNGIWAKMRPSEKDLYVSLMERSERF